MSHDLLLVGAGHTHLHVLTRASLLRDAGYRVRLLAPADFHYSGVASATAAGALPRHVGAIDVAALARTHGVEHVVARLVDLDLGGRRATASTGEVLDYDVVSLNLGSVVAERGLDVHPDVVRVKPLEGLAVLDARLRAGPAGGSVVSVVGAGATGLELAAHLATRHDVARVRLVESGPVAGAGLPDRARRRLLRLLAARGVELHVGWPVTTVGDRAVRSGDGRVLEHDVALLATGLVAPPLVTDLGLGDERGVPVRATLQHRDRDEVLAVGDCARFLPAPLARVGVHGVRQAPVLVEGLLALRRGTDLPPYEPRREALAVLDLGGGTALAVRGRWWLWGPLALRLKRGLDRRWLRRYTNG